MKHRYLMILVVSALLLSGCNEDGVYSAKIVLNGELSIPSGSTENSTILLMDGTLHVAEQGIIQGDVYQVLGNFVLDGTVDGSVVQFGGILNLGNNAHILGNLQLGGGELLGSVEEAVDGEILANQVQVPLSPEWFSESFRRQINWAIGETLLVSALATFLAAAFPDLLNRVGLAERMHTLTSAAMGILVGIVGISLIVQMIFTILLIPVSLLGTVLLVVAVAIGWAGFGWITGGWLNHRLRGNWHPVIQAGVGTILFMSVVNGINLLPGVGDLISFITALIGIGAVFLTRMGVRQFVPASSDD